MKTFKKFAALLVAALLVLAMAVPAMAEVTPATDRTTETDGSVKVTNANDNYQYTLYLLFKADMGANDAITYTANGVDLKDNAWFELNSNGFVVAKSGTADDWAKDPDAITWVKSVGTKMTTLDGATAKSTGWTGLEYGYYFVDTSMGAFVGIDSANKNAEIQEKNSEPGVDKEITGTTSGEVNDDKTQTTGDEGANEAATPQVGDTVSYQITVTAKPGAENYVVKDTLGDGLTPPAASAVTVTGLTVTTDYTVDVTGQVITVTFTKAYLDTITTDTDIVITYSAVVNESAVIGEEGNPNTVTLDYGHDPTDESKPGKTTPPDETKVYVAKISLIKKDGNDTGLADAVFALKNGEGKYYKYTAAAGEEPAKVEWVDSVDDATKYTSQADGTMNGDFTGLPNGSYTLEEVTTPSGYNAIAPTDPSLQFTIESSDYTNANLIQSTTVINNSGTELPTTGGIGTTIFYTVGSLFVLGGVVVLIARRKVRG